MCNVILYFHLCTFWWKCFTLMVSSYFRLVHSPIHTPFHRVFGLAIDLNHQTWNCRIYHNIAHPIQSPVRHLWKESRKKLLVKGLVHGCVPVWCVEATLEKSHQTSLAYRDDDESYLSLPKSYQTKKKKTFFFLWQKTWNTSRKVKSTPRKKKHQWKLAGTDLANGCRFSCLYLAKRYGEHL